MTYRVIQWATGAMGRDAIEGMVGHPDLDLVGCWVHADDKAGRDVGELAGIAPIGVKATRDKDALLAMPADCVCYMTGRQWIEDPEPALAELTQILRSGKNVANAAWPMLVNPKGVSDEVYRRLQDACLEGGTSIYTGGIDPGYGSAALALTALNVARQVRHVHMIEILNIARWQHEDFGKFFGFGRPDVSNIPILQPGVTTRYHESTLRLIADALGVEIDGIVETHRALFADKPFEIAAGPIPAGGVSGIAYQVKAMLGGEPIATVEHIVKARDNDFAELEFDGEGYRVDIQGEPRLRLDMALRSKTGNPIDGVNIACAMAAVNAIPEICNAPPGVLTARDLKPYPSKNVVR